MGYCYTARSSRQGQPCTTAPKQKQANITPQIPGKPRRSYICVMQDFGAERVPPRMQNGTPLRTGVKGAEEAQALQEGVDSLLQNLEAADGTRI